ncbi:MAG TPA: beta-ketoacyl synthase N-terminal-like domain-containing protein, partial [Vicinamibacterales bacterium]|nr:beta-ketoacyl synthase N-terminal-like domain-containing protein [Vicinamibacterales bacterium]
MSTTKRALIEIRELRARLEAAERRQAEPIAIVGMGVRLPGGVETLDGFWQLLQEGRDAISEVPADRWPVDRFFDADPSAAGKMSTRFGGFLDGVDRFDARFFGITPREAASMDPQQRLLLEVAWEALENAGQAPDQLDGHPTGVFVGLSAFDYLIAELKGTPYEAIDAYLASGGAPSVASGRLSFILGLRGPSVTVDTACSSSLTAVHLACQSLRAGDCSMALAGGVNLILLPEFNINLSKAGMMAADGRCKTFAASADGYVRSEGCGVIVLKRLSDAIANGDRVLAVVRGSAVNQDGRSSGLTVPNGPAQEDVIRGALARAGVSAAQVGYVEAHGTGTSLGDPIELRALGSVYGNGRNGDEPLWVGSVKTNLGHLESAAGVTGLIKLVLALQHQQIPPHLHVATPTSRVPWSSLGLRVPSEAVGWPGEAGGRVGAVSSFGFSGTNAHLIVGEAPVATPKPVAKDRVRHVLTLSAKSAAALRSLAERWRAFVDTINANHSLGDVCFTANAGRAHFAHRAAVVSASFAELRQGLDAVVSAREAAHVCRGELGPGPGTDVAFVFPNGLGAYPPMRALFDQEPGFRTSLERCDAIVTARLGRSVLDVILDGRMTPDGDGSDAAAAWALQASLAELWLSWGVTPRFVTGAGVGAAVAAQIAGAISADDACALAIGEAAAPAAINEPRFAIVAHETGELVSNARLQLEGFWKVSTRDHTVALDAIKTRGVDVVLHFGTAASRTDAARVTSFAAIDASTMPDVHLPVLLAQLYVRGVAIAWRDVDGPFARQRVALPTYPFER